MAGEELNAKKMKVSELRDALKERGLPTEGLKGDLVNRLEAYLEEQEFALPGEDVPTPTAAATTTVPEPPVPAPALEEPAAVEEAKPAETPKEKESTKEVSPATAEAEKETPTEPSPAPVVPEPTPAAAAKPTLEMTFAEKKAARAARFGIPVVEAKKPAGGKHQNKKRQSNDGKKKQQQGNKKQKTGEKTREKKDTPQKKKEQPLLPVEEIEKRLKRAEKFGTGDTAQTAELKAMLRKHRFATTS